MLPTEDLFVYVYVLIHVAATMAQDAHQHSVALRPSPPCLLKLRDELTHNL